MGKLMDELKLMEFEDHFTDILNCLESYELELELMREFGNFIKG